MGTNALDVILIEGVVHGALDLFLFTVNSILGR